MIEEQAKGNTAQEKVEKFTVKHKCGLHLRPAGLFVKIAQKYQADITVEKDGEIVDGKSIIALTTLNVLQNTTLTVRARGSDASQALDELADLITNNFEECT